MAARGIKARQDALARFEEQIAKSYGEGAVKRGGKKRVYDVISTGILELDAATVVGGYVEGRISMIWGFPDAGKSVLACMGIVQAQQKYPEKVCAYLDIENKFDEGFAETLGVDLSRLYLYPNADNQKVKPATAEDASDIFKDFLTSGLCSMVVLDSVGALLGNAEAQKNADEAVVTGVSKIVTRMVKHATLYAPQHNVAVVVINQVRDDLKSRFGGQQLPGGWALRHASTVQIWIRASLKKEDVKNIKVDGTDVTVAHKIVAKVERNKVGPDGAVAKWTFVHRGSEQFGPVGVDSASEAVDVGRRYGAIHLGGGGYYTLASTGERVQGREAMVELLRKSPEEIINIRNTALAVLREKITDEEMPDESPVLPEVDVMEITPAAIPEIDPELEEVAIDSEPVEEVQEAASDDDYDGDYDIYGS